MILAFLFPEAPIREHALSSADLFRTEGVYHDQIPGVYTTKLDNYTDSAMLLQAMYKGKQSVVNKAMNIYSRKKPDMTYYDALLYISEGHHIKQKHVYFWYWHGYMIFLRPLLVFFDYMNIRLLNCFFQILLLALFLIKLYKICGYAYILPFICAYFLASPTTLMLSLQFSSCFYVLMISALLLLHAYERDCLGKNYPTIFFLSGVLLSFFDFLTYPSVVIGMLIVLFLILNEFNSLLPILKRGILAIAFWVIGYISFWAGKWIIASLLLRKNCLSKAIERISLQTSNENEVVENLIPETFERNYSWFSYNAYSSIIIIVSLIMIILLIRHRIRKNWLTHIVPFLCAMSIPVLWYFFATTHSYYHYWMEYRDNMVLLFAWFSMLVKLRSDTRMEPALQ